MPSTDEKQRRAMLAMAALSGVPLRASHVAGIAEVTDIEPSLRVLIRRGLVVSADARHQLAAGIGNHLRRTDDLNPWANRTITYFTAWCERNRRSAAGLLEESEALVRVLQIAADARRWGEVLRVGRLLEGVLIGGARWGAWAIVVEQCLAAATALGDRQAEAWARHEIGTRALCLGETGLARASLNQSITMREAIDDRGAAAAARRNLAFVVAPEPEEPRQQPITRLDDRFDLDSLTLRAEALPATRSASSKPAGLLALIALLAAVLAGFAYWVRPAQQSWSAFNVAGVGALLQRESAAPVPPPQQDRTAPREPVGQAWSEQVIATPSPATGTAAPAAVGQASGFDARGVDAAAPALTAADTDRANILIFTPRPGSITRGGPTRLCYAVTGALHARVEPGIGEVTPSSTLTCLRVSPARTTTYALTASGRDGRQVRQQLVIVVR
jgi:hypothetical protein